MVVVVKLLRSGLMKDGNQNGVLRRHVWRTGARRVKDVWDTKPKGALFPGYRCSFLFPSFSVLFYFYFLSVSFSPCNMK
jgi:hypothetical protein